MLITSESAVRRLESGERGVELVELRNNGFAASSFTRAAKLRKGPALEEASELVKRGFMLILFVLGRPLIACALVICMFRARCPIDGAVALDIIDHFLNAIFRYDVTELIAKLFGSVIRTTPDVEIAALFTAVGCLFRRVFEMLGKPEAHMFDLPLAACPLQLGARKADLEIVVGIIADPT
jgi:hypothetical protein